MVTSIEDRYIKMHPESAKRFNVSKNLFPNGVTHDARNQMPFPHYITHAEGSHKWDVDGHKIIDYWTGHGSLILGHSHPDIVKAVSEQLTKGTHFSGSTDLEIEWAQRVKDLMPCVEKIRFVSSGTEAVILALRMARAYTGKTKIIKFEDHFHGWSDIAAADSWSSGGIPEDTLKGVHVLKPNDISLVENVLEQDSDVAAIILEPTGCHMGQVPVKPEFLAELREVTKRAGVVLIFDEVVTGFRISKSGAQGYFGITPDMCTMAKILAGGLPGGAVGGKEDIINMIQFRDDEKFNSNTRIPHNGTYNANPLSAVAGATALGLIADTAVNDTANAMADRLKKGLNKMLSETETKGRATGVASMVFIRLGVDINSDDDLYQFGNEEYKKILDPAMLKQFNLALYSHGVHATNRFILGSKHSDQDIDDTVDSVSKAIDDLKKEGFL